MRERRVYQVSGRSIAVLAAAIVVAAVLMPAGVMAATGSFVNIRDPWTTGTAGQARVVNNKLATETCDIGSTSANTSTCARVDAGKLRVGDGSGPLTVEQTIPTTPYAASCDGSAASFYPTCSIQVPIGKRLVVETVAMSAAIPSGQSILESSVRVTTSSTTNYFRVPLTYTATYAGNNLAYYNGTAQVRLYADSGSFLIFQIDRSTSSGTGYLGLDVSGYLV